MAYGENRTDVHIKSESRARKQQTSAKDKVFQRRKKEPNVVLKIFITSLKILFIIVLLGIMAGAGVLLGIGKAYVDSAPPLDIAKISDQSQTSFVYDSEGNLLKKIYGMEDGTPILREWVPISEIPVQLQNAFIAIEDERFRQHNGIDVKGIIRAFISNLTGKSVSGGSTITQQLIKNTLLTSERTYKRKIQEAYLAIELERKYTKDQILAAYLNTINLGNSFYGVKAAANGYFGKDLKDLTLRQMATLAGITKNPSLYNPWRTDRMDEVKQRSDTVLYKMFELGYISESEYQQALQEPITVVEPEQNQKTYNNYFIDFAIANVRQKLIQKFMNEEGLSEEEAQKKVQTLWDVGGLRIYTTIDQKIQKTLEDAVDSYNNYPALPSGVSKVGKNTLDPQPQVAAVIIDYHTGQVKALVGGRKYPDIQKPLNRAYQIKRPVGSTMKPLGVYGPALDLRTATAASVYENIPAPIEGWDPKIPYPSNFDGETGFTGLTTIRDALRRSINIVAARVFVNDVGVNNGYNYVTKFGLSISQGEKTNSGLTLGSASASPLEMAAAYGAIANKGVYIEPLAFTQVLDKDGNVLLDSSSQEKHTVLSEQAAFILTDMLKDVVSNGTGTPTKLNNMVSAGKTGTTQNLKDAWFVGFTPYYSAAVWMGHDDNLPMGSRTTGGGNAGGLWKNFMQPIHQGLKNKDIYDTVPSGVTQVNICTVSGKLATNLCYEDPRGSTVRTEYFINGTQPTEKCDYHVAAQICKESNKYITEYCPQEDITTKVFVKRPADSLYYTALTPEERAKVVDSKYEMPDPNDPANKCNIHTQEWYEQYVKPLPSDNNDLSQPTNDNGQPSGNIGPSNDNNTNVPENNKSQSDGKKSSDGQENTKPTGHDVKLPDINNILQQIRDTR